MSEENPEGPFRDNARAPDPSPMRSITAILSPIFVIGGWALVGFSLNRLEVLGYMGGLMLLSGGAMGALGLIETRPPPPDVEPVGRQVERGDRIYAKIGLGCLLGPVLLGCIGFGLLLLTCGGH